jgi:hypothetical protein
MIMMMAVVRVDHKNRHIFAARSPVLLRSEHTRAVNAHSDSGQHTRETGSTGLLLRSLVVLDFSNYLALECTARCGPRELR